MTRCFFNLVRLGVIIFSKGCKAEIIVNEANKFLDSLLDIDGVNLINGIRSLTFD